MDFYVRRYENIKLKENYSLQDNKIFKIITKQSTHEPDKHYIFNRLSLTTNHNDNYETNKNYIKKYPDEHDYYVMRGKIPIKILSLKTSQFDFDNDNIVFELEFECTTQNK